MPATTKVPLGAATTMRQWYLDVDTAGSAVAPTWVGVFGMTEFKPALESTKQDDSDFDSGGFQSKTKTAEAWSVEAKIGRKTQLADGTQYDVGQEFLRTKSFGQMGSSNSVHIRYYEMQDSGPRVEAYEGWASVSWSPDGGKMEDLNLVSVTLDGQGRLNLITHPNTGAVIPVITSVTPNNGLAAGGNLVNIKGTNFTGVTGAANVKIGGTNATNYTVISDGLIVATAPAHAAGLVDVVVTNTAGASANTALTKYTYA